MRRGNVESYILSSSEEILSDEDKIKFLQQECAVMLRYYYKKIKEGDLRSKTEILIEWIENNSANYRKDWINGCIDELSFE